MQGPPSLRVEHAFMPLTPHAGFQKRPYVSFLLDLTSLFWKCLYGFQLDLTEEKCEALTFKHGIAGAAKSGSTVPSCCQGGWGPILCFDDTRNCFELLSWACRLESMTAERPTLGTTTSSFSRAAAAAREGCRGGKLYKGRAVLRLGAGLRSPSGQSSEYPLVPYSRS